MSREIGIIRQIGQIIGESEALQDDAFYDPVQQLILTTDMLVEGRHFNTTYFSPEDLGWKAAAVNISDIAAMGGSLQYLLVSLGLPENVDAGFIEGFYMGMQTLARRVGGRIVGGDTVGAPQRVINVTAVGTLPPGHTLGQRANARPGDLLMTTGAHGLSRVGLATLRGEVPAATGVFAKAIAKHLRPMPRIEAGLRISGQLGHYALMDTSDGLGDALLKIAQASGVRMVVEQVRLPMADCVVRFAEASGQKPLDILLYGGEDFELLAAVPEIEASKLTNQGWTVIGHVEAGEPQALVVNAEGRTETDISLEKTYQHFGEHA